jgi:predicted ATPase/class 3 adenylate cyclase/DNA-binding CsgD family transcriptional regulator
MGLSSARSGAPAPLSLRARLGSICAHAFEATASSGRFRLTGRLAERTIGAVRDTAEVGERPSGTVTFLFTDVEGSTASWERHAGSMASALASHDAILRSAIASHGGVVFATAGDGFAAVFSRADAALRAAIGSQALLAGAGWPEGLALMVRMGLHTGESHERDGDYFGASVNRAARVKDAANGRQILVSSATREVLGGELGGSTTLIDLGVHELRDVIEPIRLYRVDDRAFASDPRPPRTGGVRSGNLPTESGVLLGRDADLEKVVGDLAAARVVTLTGVGGIGKTRLALVVGRSCQTEWRDGVWFAALDTIDRPDALLRSLLGLLGIDRRSQTDLESLIQGLRFRDSLLILDNCEHLLDAVAEATSAIVSSCRGVRVLATSREPLDVEGERVRRVGPLATDQGGASVALFRLRAEEAGASLDADRDMGAIVRICRRLDGIPLAIELAAARARSLRPAEIADRLDDMFRLLTGGRRVSTARHRTLRATLEWSYDLLREPERAVLERLSIFSGSFALDAVEAVGAGEPVLPGDVVDIIDCLVARSLLVPVGDADETRFRLLEPVRQLAAEKLTSRGETDSARYAHTQWYLDLIGRLGERWRAGDDQGTWPVAARELPNLRAAFDHLVETGRVDDAQRFTVLGYSPIGCHFDPVPMYDWAPRAGSLDPEHVGPWTGSLCAIAAWGAVQKDDLDGAAAWLRRGASAIEAGSTDEGLVAAAAVHHVLSGGGLAVSDAFLDRSVQGALQSGDLHRQVWVLAYAGRFEEALDAGARLGNKLLIAVARSIPTIGRQTTDEQRELFWEAAHQCHSYLMLNHAAIELGTAQVRAGAPLDGLLLLRSPARDWLLRADSRVWSVLHSMAIGFVALGEVETAARLAGAIGDRPLPFVSDRLRALLRSQLDESLDGAARARHQTAGSALDAGAAVAEALERIEALAALSSVDASVSDVDPSDLTPRQVEVAKLVAQGFTNKQIAQRLGISRFTAETHVRNILDRLGAASRSEIATWATRGALADAPTGSGTRSHT